MQREVAVANRNLIPKAILLAADEVVDMKRAVPEGDMDSAPTTRLVA